jgi:nucleoside-triphosphatase
MNEVHVATTPKRILLTGPPGVGKTTVIQRLAELLTNRPIAGFYTEEIREAGHRVGFRVATFSGGAGVLAHVNLKTARHVGRYHVDVPGFEQLVLPELTRACDIVLIDEIGKMECFSSGFVTAVREILGRGQPLVATVAIKGEGFSAEVKARPDVELWPITEANRDEMPQRLADILTAKSG